MVDRGGESQRTGQTLIDQAKRLFALWHKARDADIGRERLAGALGTVRRKVKALLEAGVRCGQKKTARTCANILKVERSLRTFARAEGVEPTNNDAERPLRRAVLWRRKSFGTRGEAGNWFVGRVLTAVQTLRQQGRDVLEFLTRVCAPGVSGGSGSVRLLPQPP